MRKRDHSVPNDNFSGEATEVQLNFTQFVAVFGGTCDNRVHDLLLFCREGLVRDDENRIVDAKKNARDEGDYKESQPNAVGFCLADGNTP